MGYRYGTASSRSVRSATASARTAAATAATKALLQQLGVMSNAHCQDLATATANIWQVAELATLPQSPDASPRHSGHRAQQQERLGLTAPATRAPINTSEIEPYQEPHGLAPSGPRRKANSSGNHILGVAPPGVTDPSATHGSASSPFSSSLALAAHSAFSRRSKDNNIANNHNLNNRNAKQHRYYQQQQLDQAAATRPSSPPQQRPQQAATAATRGRNNEAFLTSSVLIPRRGAAVAKAAAAKAATSDLPADIDSSADSNLQHSKKREKEPLLNLLPNKQPLLPLSATPVARPRSRPLLPALSPALSRLAATTQRLVSTALRSLVPQPPPTAKLYRPLLTAAPSPGARPAAPSSPTSTSTMLPLSSAAGVRGGGGASLRQYHSPLTKFVWTAFASNMVLAVVFGALCATSYKGFNSAVDQIEYGQTQGFPAGAIGAKDWQQLFLGAAISAAFAVGLTIVFHVLVLALLCCSLKSLADPGRRYGRAFALAAAIFVGLHILNIALQFRSYSPTLATWRRERQLTAPTASLLDATVVLGLLSFVNYMLLAGLLFMWQDPQDVYLLDRGSASPAGAHT